jgi:hypothetical protein
VDQLRSALQVEQSAAAITANQMMAMINRLQEEKAAAGTLRGRGGRDSGLGGSDGFEAAFPETPHRNHILDNRFGSTNVTGGPQTRVAEMPGETQYRLGALLRF